MSQFKKTLIVFCLLFIIPIVSPALVFSAKMDWQGEKLVLPKKITKKKGRRLAAVGIENVPFYYSPGKDKKLKGPKFLDLVTIYRATKYRVYYLVNYGNTEEGWGWVKAKDLIFQDSLIIQEMTEIERKRSTLQTSSDETFVCYDGDNSELKRSGNDDTNLAKAISKNNWRQTEFRLTEKVAVFAGPDRKKFKEIKNISLFNILYVYKVCLKPEKGEKGERIVRSYMFVGTKARWKNSNPRKSLLGWVQESQLIVWKSRVAVWFDKKSYGERDPVQIFKHEQDLLNYVETKRAQRAISMETEFSAPLKFFTTRFPVLKNRTKNDPPIGRESMKIAFIADGFRGTNIKETIPKHIIEEKRQSTFQLGADLKQMDIFFLIDSTTSMHPYFKVTKNAIKRFINNSKGGKKKKYRFGLALYRDYHSGKDLLFQPILQLSEQHQPLLNWLETYDLVDKGVNTDAYEAMFGGIKKSVEWAKWKKGRIKALIVIGDSGNHEPLDPQDPKLDEVVNILQRKKVLFYGINVQPHPIALFGDYYTAFLKQSKRIISKNNAWGGSEGMGVFGTKPFDPQKLESNSKEIVAYLNEIAQLSSTTQKAYKTLAKSKSGPKESTLSQKLSNVRSEHGAVVTSYLLALMKERGLKLEDVPSNLNQISEEGWVLTESLDGKKHFEPWILIGRSDLKNIIAILGILESEMVKSDPEGIEETIVGITARVSGDKPIKNDQTLADYLTRLSHIPFTKWSQLLRNTMTETEYLIQNDAVFKMELWENLCKKIASLNLVVGSLTGTIQIDKKNFICKVVDPKPKEWFFQQGRGEKYAWIPMDFVP